jgi:hypothetical protein
MTEEQRNTLVHKIYEEAKAKFKREYLIHNYDIDAGGQWFPGGDENHFDLDEVIFIGTKLREAGFDEVEIRSTTIPGINDVTAAIDYLHTSDDGVLTDH